MRTRIAGRAGRMALAMALGTLALGAAHGGAAQERVRVERQECRCVDADGKPIERCTCVVLPDVERIMTRAFSFVGSRARLGVTLTGDRDQAHQGARVLSVLEGGPADEAGIRSDDVITGIDGQRLLEPLGQDRERDFDADGNLAVQRLMALVREIEPGQEVQIEYLRDGERRTATAKARELDSWTFVAPRALEVDDARARERMGELRERLGEIRLRVPPAPAAPPRHWQCPGAEGSGGFVFRSGRCPGGLQLLALNPGLAPYFRTGEGVLVAAVHETSRLGLQAGDVVMKVDGRDASDPDRLRRILSSYGADEEISMTVMRQGREVTTRGTLGG